MDGVPQMCPEESFAGGLEGRDDSGACAEGGGREASLRGWVGGWVDQKAVQLGAGCRLGEQTGRDC